MANGKVTIVIDPGHGGSDPGTLAGGLNEQAMNLATAKAFAKRMVDVYEDVDVILTRTSDVFVGLDDRPAIANRLGGDPVFLSFHHNNSGGNEAPRGFEQYVYGPQSWCASDGSHAPRSYELARRLEPSLKAMCADLGLPYVGVKDGDFCVIRECSRRAILFEAFYASSPKDVEIAKRPDFIDRLAAGYVTAVGQALGLTPKACAAPTISDGPFVDVPADAWFADDLRFLHDAGIVNGDPNGNFRPNDALTRAEAARLMRLVVRYTTGK